MLCCRGYDRKDAWAGFLSAIFALGVAFFPTTPLQNATPQQQIAGVIHIACAVILFSILAYFCLVLFRMSARNQVPTPEKKRRNTVYFVCGIAILASMGLILLGILLERWKLAEFPHLLFAFESTALFSFGIAWLTKGDTFLKDVRPVHVHAVVTDSLIPGFSGSHSVDSSPH